MLQLLERGETDCLRIAAEAQAGGLAAAVVDDQGLTWNLNVVVKVSATLFAGVTMGRRLDPTRASP